jgi:hypothetical protein
MQVCMHVTDLIISSYVLTSLCCIFFIERKQIPNLFSSDIYQLYYPLSLPNELQNHLVKFTITITKKTVFYGNCIEFIGFVKNWHLYKMETGHSIEKVVPLYL